MTVEINDGHYLELMDRIHIIMCNINDHLLDHPLADKMNDVQKKIDEAAEKLAEAYQLVGQVMYGDNKVVCKVSKPCSSRLNGECQLIEPCSKYNLLNRKMKLCGEEMKTLKTQLKKLLRDKKFKTILQAEKELLITSIYPQKKQKNKAKV